MCIVVTAAMTRLRLGRRGPARGPGPGRAATERESARVRGLLARGLGLPLAPTLRPGPFVGSCESHGVLDFGGKFKFGRVRVTYLTWPVTERPLPVAAGLGATLPVLDLKAQARRVSESVLVRVR